ncbi:hypothetical protein ACH3VR_17470 [Microbacterium sp. B2969]|uniref:ABC transmembrane type-1 domain-containing protein n=1 Tax=Microbacterium alkaliflavum TaxID=3248839 RepID=A0ABW7QB80_9MICO
MFGDVFAAFTHQFPHWRSRSQLIALMVLMALVPVGELLVFQIFSSLLVEGTGELAGQTAVVVGLLALFFAGFAVTRGLHHVTKFWRVRLFRGAFADLQERTGVGAASWQWAQAFGVSTVIADLVQIVAVLALLVFLDLVVGAVSAILTLLVLLQVSVLYRRQIRVQRDLMESTEKSVEAPIRERVFSAEFAASAASAASGVALALVAWRTFSGGLAIATAIVMAMALRIYFGRVSGLAPTLMRFARDSLRFERDRERHAARSNADSAAGATDAVGGDTDGGAVDVPKPSEKESARRSALVDRLLIEAQRGQSAAYHNAAVRLLSSGELTERERNAMGGADAFLSYSTPWSASARDAGPIPMFWWPKPMPGSFDEWLNPYLIHATTRRAVQFVPLAGSADPPPHLVLGGSLAAFARPTSIVAGTGVSKLEARVDPGAYFVSLRGPLTARVVARGGGPAVDSFGDPRLLAGRVHRIGLGATNGRLVFVRNHSDAGIPFQLPEDVDEFPIAGAKPDQIVAAINTLSGYDGVITSSVGVTVICHSYGIPCALITLEASPRAKRVDMEFRDHLLGAGMEGDWQVHRVTPDLRSVGWRQRMIAEQVSSEKLDEIDSAIAEAMRRHAESAADDVELALDDRDEEE